MTCADLEILLCDYLDATLDSGQKLELERHLYACSACMEMWRDVSGAVTFMERAAVVEPPAELLTRILHEIPSGRFRAEGQQSKWRRLLTGWMRPLLQPRYVMGMAMTILSFSMLARFAGIDARQLRPSDLDPVKIWIAVDDRAHRTWDRGMKYYENLKLVVEIQSRIKEWAEMDQSAARRSANKQSETSGTGKAPSTERRDKK